MDTLVYPRERTLSLVTLVLGLVGWLFLLAGTAGTVLVIALAGFVGYLFAHSALIAWIKGNGVELGERQLPDVHAQFVACCERLQLARRPRAFVLNGNGRIQAYAARFLGHEVVFLLSDTLDAMRTHPDGVAFYIGHELGQLRMQHLTKQFARWPAMWLPLLGAAYARAKACTCDRHGLACSSSPGNAALALAALAAGGRRWRHVDLPALCEQAGESSGFWMSFHELVSGRPWLTRRVVRVTAGDGAVPPRHGLAWLPAVLVPYAGRLGPGFGFLVMVYLIAVLPAIAVPAYRDYTSRAHLAATLKAVDPALVAISRYYEAEHHLPATLADAGVPEHLGDGSTLELDPQGMLVTARTARGTLGFVPRVDDRRRIERWDCAHDRALEVSQVPPQCAAELP